MAYLNLTLLIIPSSPSFELSGPVFCGVTKLMISGCLGGSPSESLKERDYYNFAI